MFGFLKYWGNYSPTQERQPPLHHQWVVSIDGVAVPGTVYGQNWAEAHGNAAQAHPNINLVRLGVRREGN